MARVVDRKEQKENLYRMIAFGTFSSYEDEKGVRVYHPRTSFGWDGAEYRMDDPELSAIFDQAQEDSEALTNFRRDLIEKAAKTFDF